MPVTNPNGTPIPTNATVGGSLALLLEGPRLDIDRRAQQEDAWCYAACAQMVINHLITDGVVRQCVVASFAKRNQVPSCCPPTAEACRSRGCTEKQVGEIFLNFGLDYEGSGSPEIEIEQITRSEIRSEIGDKHPIQVVIDWDTDGGSSSHAVLITGIRDDDRVYITDPMNGLNYNGWQPFELVQQGFGEGRWVRTWTGLHKKQEVN